MFKFMDIFAAQKNNYADETRVILLLRFGNSYRNEK